MLIKIANHNKTQLLIKIVSGIENVQVDAAHHMTTKKNTNNTHHAVSF